MGLFGFLQSKKAKSQVSDQRRAGGSGKEKGEDGGEGGGEGRELAPKCWEHLV